MKPKDRKYVGPEIPDYLLMKWRKYLVHKWDLNKMVLKELKETPF